MTAYAIINQDQSLHRIVISDDVYAEHPEDCGGRHVFEVTCSPMANEVPHMVGTAFRGWKTCPKRQQLRADAKIIARMADPLQRQIYEIKEAEARAVIDGGTAGPMIRAESAATNVSIALLARLIVGRADFDRARYISALARSEGIRRASKVKDDG